MTLDIRDFNIKLENFTKEAKKLEKKDPSGAKRMWLKICEFVLEFSKQPGLDRSLKIKLWSHTNAIIKKLKNEPNLEEDKQETQPTSFTTDNTTFDFSSLPNVPTSDDFDETDNSGLPDGVENPKSEEDTFSVDNLFYSKILNMEKELKTMPVSFKEVAPKPYQPDKSIIKTKKNENLQPQVNINTNPNSILGENSIDADNDTIDVYRGTKDFDNIKDPFIPQPDNKRDNDSDHLCFACGAHIKINEKICPKCGAEL